MKISRSSSYRIPVINGKELGEGQTAAITPADKIAIKADVGDNYPIWETKPLKWGKAPDGTPQLQNTPLKPNTAVDVEGKTKPSTWAGLTDLDNDDY
jgi:hypothetical protein